MTGLADLRLGFIPLTDCAPLAVARALAPRPDALPLAELVRRRDVVQKALSEADRGEAPAALQGGEPWLAFALDLHTPLRALLRLRLFLRAGAGPLDGARLDACQRHHDEGGPAWPEALSAARLSRIAAPPGGRLTDLACADVAQRHGVAASALKRALFSVAEEG